MIAFDNMSVTFGQLVSYCLGAGFEHVSNGVSVCNFGQHTQY